MPAGLASEWMRSTSGSYSCVAACMLKLQACQARVTYAVGWSELLSHDSTSTLVVGQTSVIKHQTKYNNLVVRHSSPQRGVVLQSLHVAVGHWRPEDTKHSSSHITSNRTSKMDTCAHHPLRLDSLRSPRSLSSQYLYYVLPATFLISEVEKTGEALRSYVQLPFVKLLHVSFVSVLLIIFRS